MLLGKRGGWWYREERAVEKAVWITARSVLGREFVEIEDLTMASLKNICVVSIEPEPRVGVGGWISTSKPKDCQRQESGCFVLVFFLQSRKSRSR